MFDKKKYINIRCSKVATKLKEKKIYKKLHSANLARSLHSFLVHLLLILSGGVLVLLIFGDEVIHVGLSLGEFHLVHTLTGVPVEEGLSSEHGGELLTDSLEHLLDSS